MANQQETVRTGSTEAPKHPRCPTCEVPMWLVHIEHFSEEKAVLHYECKVCDRKAAVPTF